MRGVASARTGPRLLLALVVLIGLVLPPGAGAFDARREVGNFAKILERPAREGAAVPLPARVQATRFVNRNGALLSAHLWRPPASTDPGGRLPTVVMLSGDVIPETYYWFAAAAFARAGYLVLTFDPQGHGLSDTIGRGAQARRHVAVQQAAESGTVEAAADEDAVEQAQDALGFLLSTPQRPYLPPAIDGTPARPGHPATAAQRRQAAGAAPGGEAAHDNPFAARVDRRRIGVVGHSRGADVASFLAARDPRVSAAVAWDDLLAQTADALSVPLRPRVPVLGIADDYGQLPTPFVADPDPLVHDAGVAAARVARVDAGELVIRGGTHYEFAYHAGAPLPATLRGIDLATWYATAWLDRYVKGDAGATRRLLTGRWRADATEAAVDPSGDGNLFSYHFPSRLAIHRPSRLVGHGRRRHRAPGAPVACDDLRAGCGALEPTGRDGGPARYAVLAPDG